ncbi:MFS transporter [Streptomyces sp. NPDC056161]|uniref:MFS transporter n=1 Tax=Streptomyces sp. NPDC056161 TaxID=3345732 RepID=UPI0035D5F14E
MASTVAGERGKEQQPPAPAARLPRPQLTLTVLLCATFMQFLDVSIVNVAVPSIQRDLHAGSGTVELVASGYTLAYACVLITAGRLGDRYGYRRLFVTGMAVFTLASLACVVAPDSATLVLARVVQGLGSGLMAPQVLSVIQVEFPPSSRGKVFGSYGTAIGTATVVGPVLAGLLIALRLPGLDWRLVFAINIPVGLAAMAAFRLIPPSVRQVRERLDPVGVALVVAGLALLIYPLAVGRQQGWPAWSWGSLGAAVVVLALFARTQFRRERRGLDPLLHLRLLGDRTVRLGLLVVLAFFAGVPPFFFLLSVYLQAGFGHSALVAGLTQLPFAVATAVGSRAAGSLARRYGTVVLVCATGALAVAMAALALIVEFAGARATPWELAAPMLVGGTAFGVFTASAFTVLLAQVPASAAGSASGMLTTVQQVAGSLGLTIGAVVFFASQPLVVHQAGPAALRHTAATSFFHTLLYETAVFALACVGTVVLHRRPRDGSPVSAPASPSEG